MASEVHRGGKSRGFGHVPALDGLRGLAVAAVLLFHDGRLRGGYLGVDAFFVLSGFLITSLLLAEIGRTERVALRAFWARRFKRLLPALVLFMLGVVVFAITLAAPGELTRIRRDAFATLGYVANWNAIAQGHGYWDLFRAPSPLEHTWSLAIEEQFYLLWPLVIAGVAWFARRRQGQQTAARVVLFGSAALAAASSGLMWFLFTPGRDTTRVYMGADTRASSILVGAAAAGWFMLRPASAGGWRRRRWALEVVGVGAGLALALAWARVDGQSAGLYRGGFLLCALATIAVIAAAAHPDRGVLARLLSWSPLRWLGGISYGLYLWHWPVFIALTPARVGIDGLPLLFVKLWLSTLLALVSFHLVERPIQRGRIRIRFLPMPVAVPGAAFACALVIALATSGATPVAHTTTSALVSSAIPDVGRGLDQVAVGDQRPRVLIVGDSLANSVAGGARTEAEQYELVVANGSVNGCALNDDITGLQLLNEGRITDVQLNPPCLPSWLEAARTFQPQLVTVVFGNAAGFERFKLHGRWVGACDAGYAEWYRPTFRAALETFLAADAKVAVATLPYPIGTWLPRDARTRIDCMNALNRQVAESVGSVTTMDLGGFVCPAGRCIETVRGEPFRPDGVHFGHTEDGDVNRFVGAGAEQAADWVLGQAAALLAR